MKDHAPVWRRIAFYIEQKRYHHLRSNRSPLHYGGLQHCFESSLTTVCAPSPAQAATFLRPTAKSLPSPATFRKAITSLQSTIDKDESDAERARSFLHDIFYEIGFSSKLYCEIHNSAFIDQHINRIADSLGTGGLLMYVKVWNHWACWCQCHSYSPAEAPQTKKKIPNLQEPE